MDVRFSGLVLVCLVWGCGAAEEPGAPPPDATAVDPLLDPSHATKRAPDVFRARFFTTRGEFVIKATRQWSPAGVDRLYNLIDVGYFHDTPFYRVMPNFVAQFGFHSRKEVNAAWNSAFLPAEPNRVSNRRGTLTFAQRRPDERTAHFFINLVNNAGLDGMGFPPVAIVVEGMAVVDSVYSNYREGPSQKRIANETLAYLRENYPKLDYIKRAELLP